MEKSSEKDMLLLESYLGCSSSLFSKNVYRKIALEPNQKYIDKYCCTLKINKISINCDKIMFIAYQNNSGLTHTTKVATNELEESFIINNFRCTDTLNLNLFVFINKDVFCFKCECYPCLLINKTVIELSKVETFFKNQFESLKLSFEIFNAKKLHVLNDLPYKQKNTNKTAILIYNNKEYHTDNSCLFCFYKCNEILELIIHLYMSHLHYKITVKNEICEIFTDKDTKEVKEIKRRKHQAKRLNSDFYKESNFYFKTAFFRNRLSVLQNDIEKSKEIKIILQEKKVFYTYQNIAFLFLKKKRELNSKVEHSFPYEYYQEETFAPVNTHVVKGDWVKYFILDQLEEIIDISEKQLKLIYQWNQFIFNNRVNSSNVLQYITDFVYKEGASFEMFEFLTTLKKKCVISEDEIRMIIRDYLIY